MQNYDTEALVAHLLADSAAVRSLQEPLPDEVAAAVVERLKAEADRHWWINAHRSLELAEIIVQLGRTRDDLRQIALGTMARGDALKFLGQIEQAWAALEQAGALFQQAGDDVGWARTRIGRLALSVDLNFVQPALDDALRARAILERHGLHEMCLRVDINTANVHLYRGDHRHALQRFEAALQQAYQLGPNGTRYLAGLSSNLGYTHLALGNLQQALAYNEQARARFIEAQEVAGAALAERLIAYIHTVQGDYRRALDVLHQANDRLTTEDLPLDAACVSDEIIECYLRLNRYVEARALAHDVCAIYHACKSDLNEAKALVRFATAAAELGDLAAAQTALDQAERLFAQLGASVSVTTTQLRRGRIALRQGDVEAAQQIAHAAAEVFAHGGQQVDYADALLLGGQAALRRSDLVTAFRAGAQVLDIARRCNALPLRYSAHLLLGRVAEAQGDLRRAKRRYTAAIATVERLERRLTITLRPGFLEDKGEALRALIALYLDQGQAECAFEAIERAKSHTLLSYLNDHKQLRWTADNARDRALLEELERLREEHAWLYHLAHDPPPADAPPRPLSEQQAQTQLAQRERRMRAITEQLYLHAPGADRLSHVQPVSLHEIQAALQPDALLIAFYNDGAQHWAFTIAHDSIAAHPLALTVDALHHLINQWQINLNGALSTGDPGMTRRLTGLGQRILQRLYAELIAPLAHRCAGKQRLTIVPYGPLHYLPFHLLHTGAAYLIDLHEIVVLPAGALITRHAPERAPGALIVAHSWDGRLPETLVEAQTIGRMVAGRVALEQDARLAVFRAPPAQILHIAAHGEHRLDQPDLSYIHLADGQLYTDDLLQHDLSYELVTLSACETGRAHVAGGDELIGLGRGFLYAGAGALLVSLWRVPDRVALQLMQFVYARLQQGASKAAALREAQQALLHENPTLHPAIWGAFQLVGDPGPLSSTYRLPA